VTEMPGFFIRRCWTVNLDRVLGNPRLATATANPVDVLGSGGIVTPQKYQIIICIIILCASVHSLLRTSMSHRAAMPRRHDDASLQTKAKSKKLPMIALTLFLLGLSATIMLYLYSILLSDASFLAAAVIIVASTIILYRKLYIIIDSLRRKD
jgi:hypothetical protein